MPAFANMLGTILPNSATAEVVSTMDVFPSLLRLIDGPSAPAPIAFDGKSSLYDLLFAPTGAKSAHAFLPFYNQPNISEPATQIFAARMGRYKVHWLTSPGLGGGRYATHAPHDRAPPNEVRAWDPPLIFDVEADPSEMLPLASADLPHNLLSALAAAASHSPFECHSGACAACLRFRGWRTQIRPGPSRIPLYRSHTDP